ncbi:MAG: DNA polymerase IV [Clostridia bacterium]|nr:DNA polymerase IV [Clostridia bacterium]
MDRLILHCDLNNFYASVECVLNPDLADKYIAVCGSIDDRHGIVLAKNYKAKSMGVKTGETVWEAKQKCPDLVTVRPHGEYYVFYSLRVREIYSRYTDLIEAFGIDECWLDITNCKHSGSPQQIADRIRNEVREQTGLTISVGVACSKVYAKLGSDLKKPDATTVITRENREQVVYPLPVSDLLMIGPKTTNKLFNLGITTIGELANADEQLLKRYFGIVGPQMRNNARGEDNSAVRPNGLERTIKSVGHGTTTRVDTSTLTVAKKVIYTLSEMVATRLRRYHLKASSVHIDLRFNDLTHRSHQCSLTTPTFSAGFIADAAYCLTKQIWNPSKDLPIRTITVSTTKLSGTCDCGEQVSFFEHVSRKQEKIEQTVDSIRHKYGFGSMTRALLLENNSVVDKYCNEEDLLPFRR